MLGKVGVAESGRGMLICRPGRLGSGMSGGVLMLGSCVAVLMPFRWTNILYLRACFPANERNEKSNDVAWVTIGQRAG